jgi:G2/mitotic-specific cyclin 1/2
MNAASRRIARQHTQHDENKVHTRITRSKLATTTEITTTSTGLPSKLGNNAAAATRKRAALGDVTNAQKKAALGDVTNAVLKKDTDKPAAKRPLSRKPSTVSVPKAIESKPLASKQTTQNTASVVIPKKRPSEAVAPRRTLTQSTSSSSLAQKNNARYASRRRPEEVVEPEAPRKKQKVEPKQDWDDLDAADANDPLMVSDYVVEIFDYMRELEVSVSLKRCLTTDKNNAESLIHEATSQLGVANAWNPGGLAHRSPCQIPSSPRNTFPLRQPGRPFPISQTHRNGKTTTRRCHCSSRRKQVRGSHGS